MVFRFANEIFEPIWNRRILWHDPCMTGKNSFIKSGQKHVVIVGAGFAGLNAAKELSNRSKVIVSLFDQKNHHLFQPLLYQVATAGLNPSDIAVPIRAQFSHVENVRVHLGKVRAVNLKERWVKEVQSDIQLHYDYLILACGAQHSYFSNPEWEPLAPGLKTLEQAIEIRRRILLAFELAENEIDPEEQKTLLTFVIIGGGATGVELAGAIADISRTVLVKDFKRIDPSSAKIILVEAGPRLLAAFDESLSLQASRDLEILGVEVRTDTRVNRITEAGVQAGSDWIHARNVFWAAGVQANRLDFEPSLETDRAGRVKVNQDFTVPGFSEVFVIGDMASFEVSPKNYLPGLAPAAIQAGQYAAQVIVATICGREHAGFRYREKGQMATIGKSKAVASVGNLRITGYLAWMAWLFVHIIYLIGFKNRLFVFIVWVWSYVFSRRGSRLIIDKEWKIYPYNR